MEVVYVQYMECPCLPVRSVGGGRGGMIGASGVVSYVYPRPRGEKYMAYDEDFPSLLFVAHTGFRLYRQCCVWQLLYGLTSDPWSACGERDGPTPQEMLW
jgi:hypothetical protein